MNTIIRNFIHVLSRFHLASLLNVLGLSVAFAAFLVIMMQIDYERGFDRCYSTSDRIFRLDRIYETDGIYNSVVPGAFFEAVAASSPHIQAGALVGIGFPFFFKVKEGEQEHGFKERINFAGKDLAKIFGLETVDGNLQCLDDPNQAILPESLALKMFGTPYAAGKQLFLGDSIGYEPSRRSFTVGGVYRDLPGNCQFRNDIYIPVYESDRKEWYGQSLFGYLLLDDAEAAKLVEDNFNRTFDFKAKYGDYGNTEMHIELLPIASIYYAKAQSTYFRTGNPDTMKLLLLIAFLIIVVAGINFTNFSTAMAPIRIRSINTQKVLGSSVAGLRRMLVAEAVGISLLSYGVSLLLVAGLNRLEMLAFVQADTSLVHHPGLLIAVGSIAVVVGLVAGFYPAWYMTSVPPVMALKGSFGLSRAGRRMRTVLIGFQFVVSIVLIIGSIFIWLQNNYIRKANLGFETSQIALAELSTQLYVTYRDVLVDRLHEFPGIQGVAFADAVLGGSDGYSMREFSVDKARIYSYYLYVSDNFLDVMGIPVVAGRDFSPSDLQRDKTTPAVILTKNGADQLGIDLSQGTVRLEQGMDVVGISDDVQACSFRIGDNPFVFRLEKYPLKTLYVRLKAGTDVDKAVAHIRGVLASLDPVYPSEIHFYDEVYDNLYRQENYLKQMITLFSLLAIVISITGVFGLVVFETQYRRKEIGIRKVHGATVGDILLLFNRVYIKIVVVCFVLAAPLAWYGVEKWLENFSEHTPVYFWVFLAALLIVLAITLATVTFQNWRAATANPVRSLKSE